MKKGDEAMETTYQDLKKRIDEAIEYAKTGKVNVYNWNETLQDHTVVAFGLGKFFEDTHDRLFQMCRVDYISDNDENKRSKGELYGKKIIHPEEIAKLENPFVIAVVGGYIPIRNQMRQMGVPVMHISEMHFSEYIKGKDTQWLENSKQDIYKCLDILEDDESRSALVNIFCNRIYGSKTDTDYESFATDGGYFKTGILTVDKGEIFVDCGAYIGDTIEEFIEECDEEYKKIYTFELSRENYPTLLKTIEKYSSKDLINPYNAGVWNEKGRMSYCNFGETDGCQLIEYEGADIADLVALDDVIPVEEKVTLMKMDIEGAEQNGIKGARRILESDKPKLAICLYHRPEDLWEIPLLIKEINSEYRLFIRHQDRRNYVETILFGV